VTRYLFIKTLLVGIISFISAPATVYGILTEQFIIFSPALLATVLVVKIATVLNILVVHPIVVLGFVSFVKLFASDKSVSELLSEKTSASSFKNSSLPY
jgi:hypothetical protein